MATNDGDGANGDSGALFESSGSQPGKYLCLTILGYRKVGMSEADYRHHMTKISAPMTKDLMVKYGVKRWTIVSIVTSIVIFRSLLYFAALPNNRCARAVAITLALTSLSIRSTTQSRPAL